MTIARKQLLKVVARLCIRLTNHYLVEQQYGLRFKGRLAAYNETKTNNGKTGYITI